MSRVKHSNKRKISFLIAAHNEEKIIDKTLKNLSDFPYANYEVLVGLDGCTDNTEEIVKKYSKKSNKFRYFKLNLRKGKHTVVNNIIKKARGDIIIINDADWIFKSDKEGVKKMLGLFNNPKLGAICEPLPVSCNDEVLGIINGEINSKKYPLAYLSSAWINSRMMKFQAENYAENSDGFLILDRKKYFNSKYPFLTNVFRKKLYKENETLADDTERVHDIIDQGFNIAIVRDTKFPRMIASYNVMRYKDILKQKRRTSLARKQVRNKYGQENRLKDSYSPLNFLVREMINIRSPKLFLGVLFYLFILIFSTYQGKISNLSTSEGWKMRAKR